MVFEGWKAKRNPSGVPEMTQSYYVDQGDEDEKTQSGAKAEEARLQEEVRVALTERFGEGKAGVMMDRLKGRLQNGHRLSEEELALDPRIRHWEHAHEVVEELSDVD